MQIQKATAKESSELFQRQVLAVQVVSLSPVSDVAEIKNQQATAYSFIQWFNSDNQFPLKLAQRGRLSTTNSRIINDKVNFTVGNGFIFEGQDEQKLLKYAENVNAEGETLEEVFEKICRDWYTSGNLFLECIQAGSNQYNLEHKDFTTCRVAKANDGNKYIQYSRDWRQHNGVFTPVNIPQYPVFGPVTNDSAQIKPEYSQDRTILHVKNYQPNFEWYGLPDYYSAYASGWLDIDYQIPKFNATMFKNQFKSSGLLAFVGQNTSTEQAEKLAQEIKDNYTGEGNNSKLLVVVVNDETLIPKYVSFDDVPEGGFDKLQALANENIIIAHTWEQALLLQTPGKLSNDTEIRTAFEKVMRMVIEPNKKILLRALSKILRKMGFVFDKIDTIAVAPVSFASLIDPKLILTKNEQRHELGYEDLKDGTGDELLPFGAKAPTDSNQNPRPLKENK